MQYEKLENYLKKNQIELSAVELEFVLTYFHTNSIQLSKQYMNLELDEISRMYRDPRIQVVIQGMKLERHRQNFKTKMLNLEEMGAYLTTYLLDVNVAVADRYAPKEKLDAMKLLLEVHKQINLMLTSPTTVIPIESQEELSFKDLSVSTIKRLLETTEAPHNSSELVLPSPEDELAIDELNKSIITTEARNEKNKIIRLNRRLVKK